MAGLLDWSVGAVSGLVCVGGPVLITCVFLDDWVYVCG